MNDKTKRAYAFAKKAHHNQTRKITREPYFRHPVAVYKLLKVVTKDTDILCAGLLHDTIEDTGVTYADIKRQFGERVANIVLEVTKVKEQPHSGEPKTIAGLMVKFADRLHNISDSPSGKYFDKTLVMLEKYRHDYCNNDVSTL